jgi:hypothetical protein
VLDDPLIGDDLKAMRPPTETPIRKWKGWSRLRTQPEVVGAQ